MTIHITNGFQINNYIALAALVRSGNFSSDLLNFTLDGFNDSFKTNFAVPIDYVTNLPAVKAFFYCLYVIIFVIGVCGNVLVCYVVFRNKSMQTVTNIFITNLALSDILLCTFAVPFTPLYIFMSEWVFGAILCHLVPYAQGVSVYISAFTLMSIAIDRFFVIIYPFKPRLQINLCLSIVVLVWVSAALLTLPYGIFMDHLTAEDGRHYCDEVWPHESIRRAFGFSTSILQFVIPFIIISFCYLRVCLKLRDRARTKPGAKSLKKEEMERERTRRTNRMLISMVMIFGASWLPLNVYNLVVDFYIPAAQWKYLNAFYFLSHAAAMSSTCYNPFLYAWLNENFRKEFKTVLPCFNPPVATRRPDSIKQERTCNGHESMQETLLSRINSAKDGKSRGRDTSVKYVPETGAVRLQIVNSNNE